MEGGGDVQALTVRTYYMPNEDWRALCERGRELRESAGTLGGHAAGHEEAPVLDHAAAVRAIGVGTGDESGPVWRPDGLPEPLAAVVGYLGGELDEQGREFVPTAELAEVLGVEPVVFARQMSVLECRPVRDNVPDGNGEVRRVRGYRTSDIRAAVKQHRSDEIVSPGSSRTGTS